MSFRLVKWYLDAVSAEGEALIAYQARLWLGGAELRYQSVLERGAAGDIRQRTRFSGEAPRRDGSRLTWRSRAFGLEASFEARAAPVCRELYHRGAGRLEWRCWAPAASVEVRRKDGTALAGLGYAEELELTIAPWRLPLDELRWGRFVAAGEAVVWIDWQGAVPLRLVVRNGAPREPLTIGVDAVAWREGGEAVELRLERPATLRGGTLGTTALSGERLRRLVPAGMLRAQETKWLSRARMDDSVGWAIHELVRFR